MMIGRDLKNYAILAILILLAGCTVSKKNGPTEGFPGVEESRQITETEEDENDGEEAEVPPADVGNEMVEEPETCDPIEILAWDIPEVLAGEEEFEAQIMTRGACGFVTCVLADGPEWVSVDNCQIHGLANTAESLGEHTLTIRAQNMRDESEFVDRPFNLVVKDEPKINLFVSNSDSSALKQNVIQKDVEDFDVTLGWEIFYARIEGYADSYEVTLDNPQLQREDLGNNLYAISLASESERPSDGITITARDTHGNQVERTFNIHFLDDPCDEELRIIPVSILKEDDLEGHLSNPEQTASEEIREDNSTDVILGTKYKIVFQASGGLGPYEWLFNSKVDGGVECTPELEGRGFGACQDDVLEKNPHWKEITPSDSRWNAIGPDLTEEGGRNKAYFQLETSFSFPDNDLPYNEAGDNTIYDRLHIQATSPACLEHAGNTYQTADYTLKHSFITPNEAPQAITCRQEITDVWDTDGSSRMALTLVNGDASAVGEISYLINPCVENEALCEGTKPLDVIDTASHSVDEIIGFDLTFWDNTNRDHLCFDCDHDQADYDLISLTCETPFRFFTYRDENNLINDNVVPPEPAGVLLSAARTFGSDPVQSRAYRILIPVDIHRPGHPSRWKYRTRPDYPTPAPE